jgi:hypothetical protein
MTIYAGWCDGGPLAGQQLAHDASRYPVAVREPIPPEILALLAHAEAHGVALDMASEYRVVVGEYVWDEGAWRWRG